MPNIHPSIHIYLPTPSLARAGCNQGQFFLVKFNRFDLGFPFPKPIAISCLKNLVCSTIYPYLEGAYLDSYVSQ